MDECFSVDPLKSRNGAAAPSGGKTATDEATIKGGWKMEEKKFGLQYLVFNRKGERVTAEKWFKTDAARIKFIEKHGYEVVAYCDDNTWEG